MSSLVLQSRIENLLDRYRGGTDSPSRQELNDLYSDGCAVLLRLENEHARVKRGMAAAAHGAADDPHEAREAAGLADRDDELQLELAKLRELMSELRTTIDHAHDGETAEPPRRRFRRR